MEALTESAKVMELTCKTVAFSTMLNRFHPFRAAKKDVLKVTPVSRAKGFRSTKVAAHFGWLESDRKVEQEALACALNRSLMPMGDKTSHAEEHTASMILPCITDLSPRTRFQLWRNVEQDVWRRRVATELNSMSRLAEFG